MRVPCHLQPLRDHQVPGAGLELRLCHVEVDELKQRFEIVVGGLPEQALVHLGDERRHERDLV